MAVLDIPEIPGNRLPPSVEAQLRYQVKSILNLSNTSFPGSQPISFERKHIAERLLQHDYFLCEKSDGLRCLMLLLYEPSLHEEGCFFITRTNEYYRVLFPQLHFPLEPNDPNTFHNGTIIDGELVLDNDKNLKYLIFDCLAINGVNLCLKPFNKRLGRIQENIIKPFNKFKIIESKLVSTYPFHISLKNFFLGDQISITFDLMKKLNHKSDGLIFTCCNSPYIQNTDKTLLKWKPAEENSIDFKIQLDFNKYIDPDITDPNDPNHEYIDYDSKPSINLLICYEKFGTLSITDEEWESLKSLNEPLNGRIVEARKNKNDTWTMLRFRDDKVNGNHVSVVTKILGSINDGVSKQELISNQEEIRFKRKEREAKRRLHPQQVHPPGAHPVGTHPPPRSIQVQKRPASLIEKAEKVIPTYEEDSDESDNKRQKTS
ncbi:mRNA guanylyltransferase [Ascoidea rubescens DSM 1968]|uniref:mRNA-capping enzyme subunit alpha n=1 Tax=Ascoidea rubescens DSM 1968 TaxID=1344418 RepID=A0A1D2VQE1_9ASCO|nr:mRNA capping enzyme, alpha subunit [Ascoidea rubescens DSM 1968]ODV63775.1 mRNA capping enzyme, alpha subunit [Ascoidea rubescens DSM 1968]